MPCISFERKIHLFGENGGRETNPSWVVNLRANPSASATIDRKWRPVPAGELLPGSGEYTAAWEHSRTRTSQYRAYQEKMNRAIPIIVL